MYSSTAQRWIRKYLNQQFDLDTCEVEDIGDATVRLTDARGESMDFGINVYGDIMDARTKVKVATSDLPHTFGAPLREPGSWSNNPGWNYTATQAHSNYDEEDWDL